jgi:hypothetical protein
MSVGDAAMTRRIALVAVCRSSASETSRLRACTSSKRRTFWIAMTAWSAKVWMISICRSLNGLAVERPSASTPIGLPSRISGTPT